MFLILSIFRSAFFSQRFSGFWLPKQNAPKSQTNHLGVLLVAMLLALGSPFGIEILYVCTTLRKFLFVTDIKRNTFSYLPKFSQIRLICQLELDVFSGLMLGHPSVIIFPTRCRKKKTSEPIRDTAGPKMAPKICQVAPKGEIVYKLVTRLGGPGTGPFSESIPINLLRFLHNLMIDL